MHPFDPTSRRAFLKLVAGAATVLGCGKSEDDDAGSAEGAATEEYDYIVVGSGAGGGPLAANLARQGFAVLLLEAGEDKGASPVYQTPAWNAAASEDPGMRWDYFVRHYDDDREQAAVTKATPAGVYYPRGTGLGGCTAVNALIT